MMLVAVGTDLLSILGLCFDFHLVETFSRHGIISAPGLLFSASFLALRVHFLQSRSSTGLKTCITPRQDRRVRRSKINISAAE